MLPVGSAWLSVMCDAGSRTARWVDGLKRAFRAVVVARGATYVAAKLASEGSLLVADIGDVSQVPLAAKRNAEKMWALARSLLIWWRRPHFRNSLAYKCDLGARSVWHSAIGLRGVG
jgi:hypothetical protein